MAELADLAVEQLAVQQRDDLLCIIVNNVNSNSTLLSNTVDENCAQLRNIVICSTRLRDIDSARLHDIVNIRSTRLHDIINIQSACLCDIINISARLRDFANVYSVHLCGIVNDYCARLHNIVNIYSTRLHNINSARLRDIVNIHSALLRNIADLRFVLLSNIVSNGSASSPLPADDSSVTFPNYYHNSPRVLPYDLDDEGSQNAHRLHDLPDLKFSGLKFPGMRIMAWEVAKPATFIQREGFVTEEPRHVVERKSIKLGKEYSGIFRIESTFEGPDNRRCKITGTAFAIGESYALTAFHNTWDMKLGPAKTIVLVPDERSDVKLQPIMNCVAAAGRVEWIRSHKPEHDFCMVAVAKPFNLGVRLFPIGEVPLSCHTGEVIGYAYDFPSISKGRQLVHCKGKVWYRRTAAGVLVEHKVNTVKVNSGSPVLVNKKVVGVHNSFAACETKNYGAPINHNGNNVGHFQQALRFTRDPDSSLMNGIAHLKTATRVMNSNDGLRRNNCPRVFVYGTRNSEGP